MKRMLSNAVVLIAAWTPLLALAPSASAQLKAGAARVEITPALGDLPQPFASVESRLYARALVLQNGSTRVVLVVGDLPTIAADVLDDLSHRIAAAANTPVQNVMLAVTHTHNAVRLDNNPVGIILPGSAKVTRITGEQIVESVRKAVAALQPARAGFANGTFHLAAARGLELEPTAGHAEGAQPPAVDRALGVFKVEDQTGGLIALLVNNGPEPILAMGMKTEISADVAGVMERYVEGRFSDKAVVMYTVGAPPGTVLNTREHVPGTTPADPHALMTAVGTVLGEEVLTASAHVKTTADLPLSGAAQVLTCPGKTTTPLNTSFSCSNAPGSKLPPCVFTDHETGPVNLLIGVLHLGDLAIVHSDSNIQPSVWAEVRDHAPHPANTMLIALGYGPMHYVVPDAEYPSNSYPVTASAARRGCAEKGFVTDALRMIDLLGTPPAQ